MFYIENLKDTQLEYKTYMSLLVKKYVGFIYYGCCGIKELHHNLVQNYDNDMIKEFSFKFGLLIYLREELAFLKNKSFEYYVK